MHAQAEERHAAQLEELHVQMADMRERRHSRRARQRPKQWRLKWRARQRSRTTPSQRKPNIIRMQPKGAAAGPAGHRQAAAR